MNKKSKEPKEPKERKIEMVELELDLDDNVVAKLLEYAKVNILNDNTALINWAVNKILLEMVKRKENENGKSNNRGKRNVWN